MDWDHENQALNCDSRILSGSGALVTDRFREMLGHVQDAICESMLYQKKFPDMNIVDMHFCARAFLLYEVLLTYQKYKNGSQQLLWKKLLSHLHYILFFLQNNMPITYSLWMDLRQINIVMLKKELQLPRKRNKNCHTMEEKLISHYQQNMTRVDEFFFIIHNEREPRP